MTDLENPAGRYKRQLRNNYVELPELSPAFIAPDDAARFAHELIGDQRAGEYGGMILKDAQGRYFATRPVRGKTNNFDPGIVVSSNAKGEFIHPPGYTCYALYHSHPNNYEIFKSGLPGWSYAEINTAVQFFSTVDVGLNHFNAYFSPVHYLSSVNGVLLKYEASGSAFESALATRFFKDAQAQRLTFDSVEGEVQATAKAGTLSVIQSSEVWGWKVGRIDSTFKLYKPGNTLDVVPSAMLRPAFSPVASSLKALLNYVRNRTERVVESHYGFVLENKVSGMFIATEPKPLTVDILGLKVPVATALKASTFDTKAVFATTAQGDVVLPQGFEIVGVYCGENQYRPQSSLPAEEPSVFRHFIDPLFMATGIEAARAISRTNNAEATRALPLYIVVRDGALLEYVSTFSADEDKFLSPEHERDWIRVTRGLRQGLTKASAYVLTMAAAGELSVLYTSDLWSRTGRVTQQWQPYKHFARRILSPCFISADDAALYVHARIAGRDKKVFGGVIYQRADQRFVASEPLAVSTETFDINTVIPPEVQSFAPPGCTPVAMYHTHHVRPLQLWRSAQEEQLYRNMLEPHEVGAAITDRGSLKTRYFSTQEGALLKYSPSGSKDELRMLSQLTPLPADLWNVRKNSIQQRLRANKLKPGQYISGIAATGALEVIKGSACWGAPGVVATRSMLPLARDSLNEAVRIPACSPIFTQEQDAVRYAHAQLGARKEVQYGFVLKSNQGEAYVATQPHTDTYLSLSKVFPYDAMTQRYQWPEGFSVCAMYLAGPQVPAVLLADAVYQALISPRDIATALVTLSTLDDQAYPQKLNPALYLAPATGALLRYLPGTLSSLITAGIFRDSGNWMMEQLTTLAQTAVTYAREVAQSGELTVIKTCGVWVNPGPVLATWKPSVRELLAEQNHPRVVALGPVYAHSDDAARAVHRQLKRPHTLNTMGATLHNPSSDSWVALQPEVSNGLQANAAELIVISHRHKTSEDPLRPILPAGYSVRRLQVARDVRHVTALSEADKKRVQNMPWPVDLCYASVAMEQLANRAGDERYEVHVYVSTNDGALLLYSAGDETREVQMCGPKKAFERTEAGYFVENAQPTSLPKTSRQMLTEIAKAGQLRVLVTSPTWPALGLYRDPYFELEPEGSFEWTTPSPLQPTVTPKPGVLRDEL